MGCFSYLCNECGKPINSDSFRGEKVKLFRLKKGKILQQMEGEYDSYGRVFNRNLRESIEWIGNWITLVDESFNDDPTTGFAAIHSKCYKEDPKVISETDPDQGWGSLNEKHMEPINEQ